MAAVALASSEWPAFARAASAARCADSDARERVRLSLGREDATAVVRWLERQPPTVACQWRGVHTPIDVVCAMLGVARYHIGVASRASSRVDVEWEAYRSEVREHPCVYAAFGFQANEGADARLGGGDFTRAVFANATLDNIDDNPLWRAAQSREPRPATPRFLVMLRDAAREPVPAPVGAIDAHHDRHDVGDVRARIDAALRAIDDAMRTARDEWHAAHEAHQRRARAFERYAGVVRLERLTSDGTRVVAEVEHLARSTRDIDAFRAQTEEAYSAVMRAFIAEIRTTLPASSAVRAGDDAAVRRVIAMRANIADATHVIRERHATSSVDEAAVALERRDDLTRHFVGRATAACAVFFGDVQQAMRDARLGALAQVDAADRVTLDATVQQLEAVTHDLLNELDAPRHPSEAMRFGPLFQQLVERRRVTEVHNDKVRIIDTVCSLMRNESADGGRARAHLLLDEQLKLFAAGRWRLPSHSALRRAFDTDADILKTTDLCAVSFADSATFKAATLDVVQEGLGRLLGGAHAAVRATLTARRPRARGATIRYDAVAHYVDWYVRGVPAAWDAFRAQLRAHVASVEGVMDSVDRSTCARVLDAPAPKFEEVAEVVLLVYGMLLGA